MSETAVNPTDAVDTTKAVPATVAVPAPEVVVPAQATAETIPAPATEAVPAPVGEPRRTPGLAVRAGAAVVAAALLGVVIGVGIIKTEYDDPAPAAAPAPTATASASPAFGAKSNGTHFGSMRDLLIPVPTGYKLGPDAGAYGNDTELTEEQRKAWIEDSIRGLPPKLQDALRKDWQEWRLKGGGVRSVVTDDRGFVVTIWLLQYHQDAVKADNAWVGALGSDSGLFRLGPQIPGHDEAHCYLPHAQPGQKVDSLICSAAEGDIRVEMQVEGIAPLPKDKAVTIFNQQLDRLARPGASA
ncbi:hypothetical protein GCM10010193_36950 [Kitasatospora atroaurantiaca]|uniref:Uncharacterized protein n=1 Tax=Kitasatospora atroaurantiaca TaxID=285545 RepID=A0A561ET17_9ACTN|nr:hypothetical protein [Kitasatospora atroaurantiaca]TWE18762.1 hypothetical protein FB465_3851 [Kitasatospora atroaurantiaca]